MEPTGRTATVTGITIQRFGPGRPDRRGLDELGHARDAPAVRHRPPASRTVARTGSGGRSLQRPLAAPSPQPLLSDPAHPGCRARPGGHRPCQSVQARDLRATWPARPSPSRPSPGVPQCRCPWRVTSASRASPDLGRAALRGRRSPSPQVERDRTAPARPESRMSRSDRPCAAWPALASRQRPGCNVCHLRPELGLRPAPALPGARASDAAAAIRAP